MEEFNEQNISNESKETEETKKDCGCCHDAKYEKKAEVKHEAGVSVFVLGLLSLVLSGLGYFLLPFVGFILGLIAVVRGNKPRKLEEMPGLIYAGWVMGIIGMIVCAVVIFANIGQLGVVLLPYHIYLRHFYF